MHQEDQRESGRYRLPPLILTAETPMDIIGKENYTMFLDFYRIASSPSNGGEFPEKRLNKEIGKENRPHIAETLKRLRDNGFYPDGFMANGDIRWRIALKSKCQIEFERGLDELHGKPKEELRHIARAGFHDIGAIEAQQ